MKVNDHFACCHLVLTMVINNYGNLTPKISLNIHFSPVLSDSLPFYQMPNITWASQLHPEYSCDASNPTDSMSDDGLTFNDDDHLGMRHKAFFFSFLFASKLGIIMIFICLLFAIFSRCSAFHRPPVIIIVVFFTGTLWTVSQNKVTQGSSQCTAFLSIHVALTSPFWTTNSFIYSPIGVPVIVPWNVLCSLRDTVRAFKHIPHV